MNAPEETSRLSIRAAQPADASAVGRLSGELGYPTTTEEAAKRLGGFIGSPVDAVLVAEIGGEVVGWIHVMGARRVESEPFAEIAGLVVSAGARGRGIGRELVAAAERWAAERGYPTLRLRSNVIRSDAHRFYEGIGFTRTKSQAVFSKKTPSPAGSPPSVQVFTVIGHVLSPVSEQTDRGWGTVTSRIVLLPPFQSGLSGLADFSHVIVVTDLHLAQFEPSRHLIRRPRGLPTMPEMGIFAQRAKDRPSPIGITAVRLLEVGPEAITVRGLDAINGTPVLDIKPYVPQYDRVDAAAVPSWVDELMRDYF